MIGRNRLYRNLKTIFGIARQPTKQCESWPVIWKPFVVEANRKQWGFSPTIRARDRSRRITIREVRVKNLHDRFLFKKDHLFAVLIFFFFHKAEPKERFPQ